MNVLLNKWIPVSGQKITISELLSGKVDVEDVLFKSPEMGRFFKIFMHGIVQTVFCPSSKKKWNELYESNPSHEYLEKTFQDFKYIHLFELSYPDGGGFMQFNKANENSESTSNLEIKGLFLDGMKSSASSFDTPEGYVSRWFTLNRRDSRGVCKECASFFIWMYQTTAYKAGEPQYGSVSGDKSAFACFEAKEDSSIPFWKECVLNVVPFSGGVDKSDFSWLDLAQRKVDKVKTDKKRKVIESKGKVFNPENDAVYESKPSPLKIKDISSPVMPYLFSPRKVLLTSDSNMTGKCKCGLCGETTSDAYTNIYRSAFGLKLGDIPRIPPYSIKNFYTDKEKNIQFSLLKLRYSESMMFGLSKTFLSSMKLSDTQKSVFDMRANSFDIDFIERNNLEDEIEMAIFGLDSSGSELTMFIDNKVGYWNSSQEDLELFNNLAEWANKVCYFAIKAICIASSTSSIGKRKPKYFDETLKTFNRKSVDLAHGFMKDTGKIEFNEVSLRQYSRELITFVRNGACHQIDLYCSKNPMAAGKGYKKLTDMLKKQGSSICMDVMGFEEDTSLDKKYKNKEAVTQ